MNYKLKPNVDIYEAISNLNVLAEYGQKQNLQATNYIRPLENAEPGTISFCYHNSISGREIRQSKASIILADIRSKDMVIPNIHQHIIFFENVKLSFINLLKSITIPETPSFLVPDYLGEGCIDLSHVYIGPHVTIEQNVNIGENVELIGNNYIFSGTKIGKNVVIEPGTIIGGQGFGYALEGQKRIHFPHLGGVIIRDDVRIGSNVCIDKGILGDTILNQGCKIDNLVHIAHDVIIGENSIIVGNTMICGYVKIGNNVRIAPSVSIIQRKNISDNSFLGVGSVIIKDVDGGKRVFGVPARQISNSCGDFE